MLEAVHVGRLAPISQHGASEAQVEVDWSGPVSWLCTEGEKQFNGHWLESSSCSLVLPVLVFGIKNGLGKRVWRT